MSRVVFPFLLAAVGAAFSFGGTPAGAHQVKTSPPQSTPTAPSTPTVTPTVAHPAIEALLTAINRDRKAHRAPPLVLDAHQSSCSLQHSKHMAGTGMLAHDQFPADLCIPFRMAGENIGEADGSPSSTLLLLNQGMMAEGPCTRNPCPQSQFEAHGHYLNLINPGYKRIGIGVAHHLGITWLTEDFTG